MYSRPGIWNPFLKDDFHQCFKYWFHLLFWPDYRLAENISTIALWHLGHLNSQSPFNSCNRLSIYPCMHSPTHFSFMLPPIQINSKTLQTKNCHTEWHAKNLETYEAIYFQHSSVDNDEWNCWVLVCFLRNWCQYRLNHFMCLPFMHDDVDFCISLPTFINFVLVVSCAILWFEDNF